MSKADEIKTVIEEVINPSLEGHGGCCIFKSFENGVVTVSMGGGCTGCPGRARTFNEGIKPFLLDNYPEVKEVRLV